MKENRSEISFTKSHFVFTTMYLGIILLYFNVWTHIFLVYNLVKEKHLKRIDFFEKNAHTAAWSELMLFLLTT